MEKNSPQEPYVKIFLDSIEVSLKIGLYAHEQNVRQRVRVRLELYADLSYLRGVNEGNIIDYAPLFEAIKAWEEREQVGLIEAYLPEAVDLCFAHPQVSACRVSIHKLDIFGRDQGAGIEVFTPREGWA